jgi:Ser/Thr protein kinase RdoA (MazF antagonist)
MDAAISGCHDQHKLAACTPLFETLLDMELDPAMFATWLKRPLHGDLKLGNILFDRSLEHAIAVIDLDTLGLYPLPLELGDMLRSFCKEKDPTIFSTQLWHASVDGYMSLATFITDEERSALPDGFELMSAALVARYVTDAFEESYFVFDADKFPSLFVQNLTRARSLMTYLKDFRSKRHLLA